MSPMLFVDKIVQRSLLFLGIGALVIGTSVDSAAWKWTAGILLGGSVAYYIWARIRADRMLYRSQQHD